MCLHKQKALQIGNIYGIFIVISWCDVAKPLAKTPVTAVTPSFAKEGRGLTPYKPNNRRTTYDAHVSPAAAGANIILPHKWRPCDAIGATLIGVSRE